MTEPCEPAKKVSTRQRIINTALKLFNQRGYGNVTTAMLAKETGIAEGNLWYHFRDKAALLKVLHEAFEASIEERLTIRPTGGPILPEYLGYFYRMSRELNDYRFLFQDQELYGGYISDRVKQIPTQYREAKQQYLDFFLAMREQKHLDMSDVELEHVVVALLLLFRYYLEFAEEAHLAENRGIDAVRRSFALHMRLFEDRLTPEAAAFFRSELKLDELPERIM